MTIGKYDHKNATPWDNALINKLSKATEKPAQSIRQTTTKLAKQIGVNLKELHTETIVIDWFEFSYTPNTCTIYVYVNKSNPKVLVDEITYKTIAKAKKNFETIKNFDGEASDITVTTPDCTIKNQQYEKELEAQ